MADINPEQREAMERFYEALQGATRSMGPLEQEERVLAETTKKTSERFETLGRNLNQFGRDFGSTMTSASEGTAKYSQATRSAAQAAGDLFGSFGILGKIVGGVIKLFGGVIASSLEQNEKLIKSYQNLSDFGAIDSSGVEGLQKDLNQSMKLLIEQAGIYEGALKKLQPELSALGGSASLGRKKFTEVMSNIIGTQLESDLRMFGMTQEDIANHAAQELARQARLGNSQNKNTQQLTEGTGKYLKELQELTMLTGLNREDLQRMRDAQMAEVRFNDFVENVRKKDAKAAENFLNTSIMLEKYFGRDFATQYRETTANFSGVVGEASTKIHIATGGQIKTINDQILAGADYVTATKAIGHAVDRTYRGFGAAVTISRELAESLGLADQAVMGSRQVINLSDKEARDQLMKDIQNNKGKMAEEVKRALTERDTKLMLDNLVAAIGTKVIPLFTKLAEVTRYLAKTFAYIVDKFGYVVGMGDLNLSAAFATNLEDATEILKDEEKKLADITKERIKTEEKLQKVQKEKLKLEEEEKEGFGAKAPWKYQDLTRKRVEEESLKDKVKSLRERQSAAKTNVGDLKDIKKSHEDTAAAKSAEDTAKAAAARKNAAATDERRTDSPQARAARAAEPSNKSGKPKDPLAKLNLKSPESVAGGESSPKLLALAEKIQEMIPNARFTALNDLYHKSENYKNERAKKGITGPSSHERGVALDMTLPDDQVDSPEKRKQIIDQLRGLGFSKVLDEYAKLSPGATGGHFHAEIPQALHGGMFSGPATGYNVRMHSDELVIPKEQASVKKTSLNDLGSSNNASTTDMMDMFTSKLEAKLDTMIDFMSRSHMTQEELLQYTRA